MQSPEIMTWQMWAPAQLIEPSLVPGLAALKMPSLPLDSLAFYPEPREQGKEQSAKWWCTLRHKGEETVKVKKMVRRKVKQRWDQL